MIFTLLHVVYEAQSFHSMQHHYLLFNILRKGTFSFNWCKTVINVLVFKMPFGQGHLPLKAIFFFREFQGTCQLPGITKNRNYDLKTNLEQMVSLRRMRKEITKFLQKLANLISAVYVIHQAELFISMRLLLLLHFNKLPQVWQVSLPVQTSKEFGESTGHLIDAFVLFNK